MLNRGLGQGAIRNKILTFEKYRDNVLIDAPVYYFRMDTTTGLETSIGSNNTGLTYSVGNNRGVTGLLTNSNNLATRFNGTTNATFTNNSITTKSDITFECIVKLSATALNGSFLKFPNNGTGVGIGVGGTTMDNSGNNLILISESIVWFPTNIPLTLNTRHVVVTVTTTGNFTAYLDGVQVYTIAGITWNYTHENTFFVGGYSNGGFDRFLNGTLDEVAIYNKILPLNRIQSHANLR